MAESLPFYLREDDPPGKREILRAAMKLFSSSGLAATSIRSIAEESGYTNPALYKHFPGKEEMARHLFETCHRRVWALCSAALAKADDFNGKLDAYITQWLELIDQHPDVMAFLADNARALWPRSSPAVRRMTMIGLARSLFEERKRPRNRGSAIDTNLLAASLQGTLSELARMIQVGVVPGPATRWKDGLVGLFRKSSA